MALEDFRSDMETCCRCSACKFIPMEIVKGYDHTNVCPSIARYNFHAYSGGGRMDIGSALLDQKLEYTDKLLEVVYNCQMCGACDISCKYAMDMEVLEPLYETRIRCVETGQTIPVLDDVIKKLKKQGAMVDSNQTKEGEWAKDLNVKNYMAQEAEVIYHVGCRTALDRERWKVAKMTMSLLQEAEVDVGIAGKYEACCGGRAYQMGYKEAFLKQANQMIKRFQKSKARILVTGCAECYHAFKVLYHQFNLNCDLEILHITEYLERLIENGKLKPTRTVNTRVTYHDPCHLGRLGESYSHWQGKKVPGHMRMFDPPKTFRRGTYGVYEPPRNVLTQIPGLKITEMDRIKEYAWCCGAGGGVSESNPEFAIWTAGQRIAEAESTGAEAIVSACPGCEKLLQAAVSENKSTLKVYDIIELLAQSVKTRSL